MNLDCTRCGAEAELHSSNLCWSCVLSDTVQDLLTDPTTGAVHPSLVPVMRGIAGMQRPNSGLTWIRQPHVTAFLKTLATMPVLNHDTIDALPPSRTREYVRGLLEQHGVLPTRDPYQAKFEQWAELALERLSDASDRDAINRYIRWDHLRRMRQMDPVPRGTFLRSKQAVTVAIELVTWLRDHHDGLAQLNQATLDQWISEGTSTRLHVRPFITWSAKARLTPPGLTVRTHKRGSATMGAAEQDRAIAHALTPDVMTDRDRAAAVLVLILGQQLVDVAALTWDAVEVDERVTITIANTPVDLPPPLDAPWRALAAQPRPCLTAAHPHSNWVFLGNQPGQHITPSHLAQRLSKHFPPRPARLGTLHELAKLAPTPIIADVLGYSPATIDRHALDSAANYAEYIATRITTSRG